jgi:prepilin-type N-terminal cleavage/methylation domain-containing protein
MIRMRFNSVVRGFTMIEMAFVLLIMGIVVSALIPSVAELHHKSLAQDDRKLISSLKEVLIGQFLATGKLPVCMSNNVGTPSAIGNCNTVNSLGGLATRITDSRGNAIRYDVRTELTASTLTLASACTQLNALIGAGDTGYPKICASPPDYGNAASWTTYCSIQKDVAFVLRGTGVNRDGTNGEQAASTAAVLGNRNIGVDRVFENPSRRHDEGWRYDDLEEVVTLQELRAAIPSTSCP